MKTYLLAVPITRWWMRRDGLRQQAMQIRGRDALLTLVDDRDRRVQRVLDATAGLRRDEPVIHPRRELEFARDLTLDGRGHLRAARDEIPLIDREHEADIRLERVARNVQILSSDALRGVGDEDRGVGPLESADRAQQREL